MKSLNKININTSRYWDDIYQNEVARERMRANYERYILLANYAYEKDVILDIGCGSGDQCSLIQDIRPETKVFGIDISPVGILMAQSRYPKMNFKIASANKTGFKDNYFDLVICGETLEHLEEPEKAIKEAARIVKKGKRYLISCPFNEDKKTRENEHLWSFDGNDLNEICRKYFKKVWFFPWASGTRVIYGLDGKVVSSIGRLDYLLVLAVK